MEEQGERCRLAILSRPPALVIAAAAAAAAAADPGPAARSTSPGSLCDQRRESRDRHRDRRDRRGWSPLAESPPSPTSEEHHVNPPDPFEALQQGELIADSLAQALAPAYIRKPGPLVLLAIDCYSEN